MLHEVLFSLWHCPGDLFKESEENDWVESISMQEFLHPGEKKLLQKILKISLNYHNIEKFRKSIDSLGQWGVAQMKADSYLIVFCNGLDNVLEDYRKEIIGLEEKFLENPHLTLTYVLATMEKYVMLFDMIKSMIRTITNEQIHGCLLMGRLHMYTISGIPQIVTAANKIIQSVNTMFYRHLANWIIYGDLMDANNEFFIRDCKCDDENFQFPEQIESVQNVDSHVSNIKKSRVRKPCTVRKFEIRPDMLPSILPLETAESILYMGRIVWIISNDPKRKDDVQKMKFRRDIWEGRSVEFYKKIEQLETQTFNLVNFERTIQVCKNTVTNYLWGVMVEEAELLEHLQIIRDYYALGRGELFQQFIVVAEEHLKQIPNYYIVKNLNTVFNETARKMYGENDKSYMKFELTMPNHLESKNYASNPMSNLEIYFDINWPLHIIFHPKVMSLYNRLFSFLLRLKKTHIDLHTLWLNHMEKKVKIDRGVWTLRHNLMFLVNNLQYYFQVDVIEAHFSLLKTAIKSATEFKDIIRMHSTFLSNLMSKTFVMCLDDNTGKDRGNNLYQLPSLNFERENIVYNIIVQLLELCNKFCLLASTWSGELSDLELNDLEDFQTQSDTITETLMRALFSLHEKVSGHHLLQLLHRLDFNRWYTKRKPDFNITIG
ncbi:PREDICTED: gamma-tubulin complex component 4 isoform X2 [Nicrophorus vespilloides]|uniref:Gamma-tubulin complex component n=1 Tax=Nicrophorus vespilloides TaxID=110193 RepID=A0ABM1MLM2_NICVS|nr:PREDICTED: gamma-tubulin complex component 4 isoform X2 [Nicrophorus vespilloides]